MALTEAKLDQARDAVSAIQEAASRINEILVKVSEVILADDEGNPIVSLTADQKDKLKTEYGKAKTALNDAIIELP